MTTVYLQRTNADKPDITIFDILRDQSKALVEYTSN